MADLLKDGLRFLEEQRKMFMTVPVVYRRGEAEISVAATIGKTKYDIGVEESVRVGSHTVDFLIAAEDLVFDGVPVVPGPDDEIDYNGSTYSVVRLADDGCWRWSDPHGNTYRIHTRFSA